MNNTKHRIGMTLITLILVAGIILTGYVGNTASGEARDRLDLAVKYLHESQYQKAILSYEEGIKIAYRQAYERMIGKNETVPANGTGSEQGGRSELTPEMQMEVDMILPTPQEIYDFRARSQNENGPEFYKDSCYYDQKTNIAYVAYVFGSNAGLKDVGKAESYWKVKPENCWKIHIFRIHNPKFSAASAINSPEFQRYAQEEGISQVLDWGGCWHPVDIGEFSFEEAVRAGYRGESPIWVDM